MQRRRLRRVAGGVLALLLALVALAVDGEAWMRPLAQHYVRVHADRRIDFERIAFRLDASGRPLIRMRGLTLENAPWAGSRAPLIRAGEVEVVFDWPWPGREGTWVERLRLVDAEVDLERQADGRRNWRIADPEDRGPGRVRIRRLETVRSTLTLRQRALDLELRLVSVPVGAGSRSGSGSASASASGYAPASAPGTSVQAETGLPPIAQRIALEGRRSGVDFTGTIEAGERLTLFDTHESFALRGELRSGASRLVLDGRARDLFRFDALDVDLQATSADGFAALATIARGARARPAWLPALPSELRAARLQKDGPRWRLDGFALQVGRSDVAGEVEFDERARSVEPAASAASADPHWQARLASRRLDVGQWREASRRASADAAAATARGSTATSDVGRREPAVLPEGAAPGPAIAASSPRLGATPARPPRFDAALDWRVETIDGLPFGPIGAAHLVGRVDDGLWRTTVLELGVAGGRLGGSLRFDAGPTPGTLAIDLRAVDVRLEALHLKTAGGLLTATLVARSSGDTLPTLLAAASGTLRGSVSRLALDPRLAAELELNGGRWLRSLFGGSERGNRVPVDCAVFELALEDGAAHVRRLAAESAAWRLGGTGTIDLPQRTLDLRLTTERQQFALLALDRSIRVAGPLAKPKVSLVDRVPITGPRCTVDARR